MEMQTTLLNRTTSKFGKSPDLVLKPRARLYVPREEQEEANAYWADVEHKKWVVLFSRGQGKKKEYKDCFVGGRTSEAAIQNARECVKMLCHPWAHRPKISVSARLATYKDLGAQRVAEPVPQALGIQFQAPA